ncbi:MAG: hypothetical protein JXA71_11225 [Chitinispirillaceae bacterium]|nr:hypothetical protein [Chitinispirillaceae bacterium]
MHTPAEAAVYDQSPGRYQKFVRCVTVVIVLCIIAISAIAVGMARNARGPGWLSHNLDPDYSYLLNALNFAKLQSAGHYDHPGTPVQLIGAVTVRAAHLFGNKGRAIDRDVCERPEYFLGCMYGVFFALVLCALGMAAARMYTSGGSAAVTLLVAGMFIASPTLLVEATRVTPEPILIVTALLLQIALLFSAQKGSVGYRDALLLAAVVGFGCAVKITFLPLVLVPLFLLHDLRSRTVAVVGSLLFFIIFTLPIAVHYFAIARWLLNVFLHTGRYGYGPEGVIVLPEYLATLQRLLLAEPLLVVGIGCGAAYAVGLLVTGTLRVKWKDPHFRIIAGATAAQIGQLFMVAKHPDPRYLVPALCFSGFTVACVISQLLAGGRVLRRMAMAVAVVFIVVLLGGAINGQRSITGLVDKRIDGLTLSALAGKDTAAITVYYYSASSLPYALHFGNGYAGRRCSGLLAGLYGKAFFYNPWHGGYESFNGAVAREDIFRSGKAVQFQGYSFPGYYAPAGGKKPHDSLVTVAEKGGEALYRIVGAPGGTGR